MRWLYLHFPHLQRDSLLPAETDADQALIIVGPAPHPIVQLNPAAEAAGLKTGMGLASAASLCQALTIMSHDPDFEIRRLHELANACYALTADIVVCAPQGIACHITPMLKLYGDLHNYLHSIKALLDSQQVSPVMACAPTLSAARLLASNGIAQESDDPDQVQTQLQRLPVRCLPLAARQQQLLERLGIATLAQLQQLPRNEVGPRVGIEVLDLLDRLNGHKAETHRYFMPAARFERSLILEHELSHSQALLFPLKRVLQQLQQFLQQRASRIQHLQIVLGHRDQSEQALHLASGEPESRAEVWLNLLQLKLERLSLQAPVIHLRLVVEQLLARDEDTPDLFSAQQGLTPTQLLSRLQARLGQQAVQHFELQEDYRPEHAFRHAHIDHLRHAETASTLPAPALRPSLLFEPARPLSEPLRIVHGPERIQTAWWSDAAVCRDYFVAHNTQGQTLWVYRDLEQRWFVHGLFA